QGSTISNVGFPSSGTARYHDTSGVAVTVLTRLGSPSGLSDFAVTLKLYTGAGLMLPSPSITHDFSVSGLSDAGSGDKPALPNAAGPFSTLGSIAPFASGLGGLAVAASTAASVGNCPLTATTQYCIAVTRGVGVAVVGLF